MISGDVKSNIKQQEIKDLVAVSDKFYKKYLQNFKYNVKKVCIFQLILVGYLVTVPNEKGGYKIAIE